MMMAMLAMMKTTKIQQKNNNGNTSNKKDNNNDYNVSNHSDIDDGDVDENGNDGYGINFVRLYS